MFNKLLDLLPYDLLIRGMVISFVVVALSLYAMAS